MRIVDKARVKREPCSLGQAPSARYKASHLSRWPVFFISTEIYVRIKLFVAWFPDLVFNIIPEHCICCPSTIALCNR